METVVIFLFASLSRITATDKYTPREYYGPMDGRLDNGYSSLYPYQDGNYYDTTGYLSDYRGDDWSTLLGPHSLLSRPHCMNIPSNLTLCQNLDYTRMRLPNYLEHDSINEVIEQSRPWNSLVSIDCHPDTKIFLCSLFAPVCLESFQPIIQPCRSLCQEVKNGCERRMSNWGLPWPDILKCDRFPLSNGMCIRPQARMAKNRKSLCPACAQPDTFEAIMDNYCASPSVMRVNIRKILKKSNDGSIRLVTGSRKRFYKEEDGMRLLKKRQIKSMNMKITDAEKCLCELKKKTKYLVMGQMVNGEFITKALHKFNGKSKEMKKAMRVMRKNTNICQKQGMEVLKIEEQVEAEVPSRKRRDRENKNKHENN